MIAKASFSQLQDQIRGSVGVFPTKEQTPLSFEDQAVRYEDIARRFLSAAQTDPSFAEARLATAAVKKTGIENRIKHLRNLHDQYP